MPQDIRKDMNIHQADIFAERKTAGYKFLHKLKHCLNLRTDKKTFVYSKAS